MHPVLFDFDFLGQRFRLETFSVFIALGVAAGIAAAALLSPDIRKKPVAHTLYLLALLLAAFLGAKFLEYFIELPGLLARGYDAARAFALSGNTVNGGLAAGGLVLLALALWDPFRALTWRSVDALAAAFPLGHALGRVGCFFNGCCYGKLCPADFPLAITYPPEWIIDEPRYFPQGIAHGPRIPSPLIEAAGLLLIAGILVLVVRRTKARGQALPLYLMLYGLLRFFQEFTRDDDYRGIEGSLSSGQWTSIAVFALGLILLALFAARYRAGKAFPPFRTLNGKEPREADAFSGK